MVQLKRIVDATNCVIVVSSTWRQTPVSLRALRLQLQLAGIDLARVVGCTPVIGSRAVEITEWLRRERGGECSTIYCVLDDWDVSGSGFDTTRLVQCEGSQGLTVEKADAAIALLTGGC
jgi:hypothetical protein